MVDESDSQPNSKARWLAISGAFITGSAGIVMAVYSVMSGDETGGGALLAASALAFGLLAAYVDKVPKSSNRNEAAYEAASANGSAPDSEADALAGSAKLDVEPITERELEVLCHVAEGYSNKLISTELGISGGYVNRCVNDIRRRPFQPLIQWRFHPHTVHRGRRLRSTQGPSDA